MFKFSSVVAALFAVSASFTGAPAYAKNVTSNNYEQSIGVYANTEAGLARCFADLDANKAKFYQPTDTRHFDAKLAHRPLEAATCGRLLVAIDHGSIGIIALAVGTEVNTRTLPNGKVVVVALRACNNALVLEQRPTRRVIEQPTVTPTIISPVIVPAPQTKVEVQQPAPVHVYQKQEVIVHTQTVFTEMRDEPVYARQEQTLYVPSRQVEVVQDDCNCQSGAPVQVQHRTVQKYLRCGQRYMGFTASHDGLYEFDIED